MQYGSIFIDCKYNERKYPKIHSYNRSAGPFYYNKIQFHSSVLIQYVVRRYLLMKKFNQTPIEGERIRSKVQKKTETAISHITSGEIRIATNHITNVLRCAIDLVKTNIYNMVCIDRGK